MCTPIAKQVDVSTRLESYILIWLDKRPSIIDTQPEIQKQLRSVINNFKIFYNLDECRKFIEKIKDEYLIIISNEEWGKQLVSTMDQWPQINTIYVYCMSDQLEATRSEFKHHTKITITSIDELVPKVLHDQRIRERRENFLFFDNSEERQANGGTTMPSYSFLMFELFLDVTLLAYRAGDKDELINLCKIEYNGNEIERHRIDEFQQTYTPETAITWYTKDCFVYRILNKALRMQNINVLLACRFLIRDIHEQLVKLQQEQNINTITVYRGQIIPVADLERMKRNEGELISFHSFLSTSYYPRQAIGFAISKPDDDNFINVLFEIECDQSLSSLSTSKPFANVQALSCIDGKNEVLFTIGSHFRLDRIRYDQEHDLHIIKLTYISVIPTMEDYINKEIYDMSARFHLPNFFRYREVDEQHQDVYKNLLNRLSDQQSKAMIYIVAGNGAREQQKFDLALEYLQKALDIHSSISPRNDKLIYQIKAYMCIVYERKGDLEQAKIKFDEMYNDIQNTSSYHTDTSLSEDNLILDTYDTISKRQEIYLPIDVDYDPRTRTYRHIIGIKFYKDELDIAILHYQKMLAICNKTTAIEDALHCSSFSTLGRLLDYKRQLEQSMKDGKYETRSS
ncbi:unnamed protein product [Adineta steineri]|uniref:Uncharacterized protein n=1 Tax=Adineta steineri TaxID=433720 RepID=A0A815SW83_9BILA|nr:unnamed protein product [Adineta steineri]CAF3802449.1 unnamed protein product [Adineta steineri]